MTCLNYHNVYTEIVKIIIDVAEDKNPKNYNGWTPLHCAVKNGHVAIGKSNSLLY